MQLLIIDDHRVFSASLSRLLSESLPDAEVHTAERVDQVLELLSEHHIDVAVVDWKLDDGITGADAIAVIQRASPTTRTLVLTGEGDDDALRHAVAAGCDGFITKQRSADEVVSAIDAIAGGQVHFEPVALTRILNEPEPTAPELTDREIELVRLLADGRSNKQLAAELYLSPNTVRNHLHRIGKKLGASSRLDIVVRAVQLGLVDLDVKSY